MLQIGRRMIHGVAFAALMLLFGTTAQALIFTGHFDPGSNGVTPGFSGDVTVDIAANCLDSEGWQATGTVSCGTSNVLDALVTIFDSVDDPPPPGTPTETLDFGGASILGVLISDGQITGFDTDPMGPQDGSVPPFDLHTYFIQFVSGACPGDVCTTPPSGCGIECSFLASHGDPIFLYQDVYDLDHQSNPAQFTTPLRQIPEPGTLSLILGAAGFGWLRRRRQGR